MISLKFHIIPNTFMIITQLFNLVCTMRFWYKKSLKISKGQSESVFRRRTNSTMAKRKRTKGRTTIYKTYI
jgi:hypothetical protein